MQYSALKSECLCPFTDSVGKFDSSSFHDSSQKHLLEKTVVIHSALYHLKILNYYDVQYHLYFVYKFKLDFIKKCMKIRMKSAFFLLRRLTFRRVFIVSDGFQQKMIQVVNTVCPFPLFNIVFSLYSSKHKS